MGKGLSSSKWTMRGSNSAGSAQALHSEAQELESRQTLMPYSFGEGIPQFRRTGHVPIVLKGNLSEEGKGAGMPFADHVPFLDGNNNAVACSRTSHRQLARLMTIPRLVV